MHLAIYGPMTAPSTIRFRKMNGLGNDFVVLDGREQLLSIGPEEAEFIADRNIGVGCDQVIVLERSGKADTYMRVLNADGSEVEACGNATRCVAMLLSEESGQPNSTVETGSGVLAAMFNGADDVTVDMGVPRFAWDEIPLAEEFRDTRGIELQIGPIDDPVLHSPSVVNVGNPHAVFWVDDVDAYDLHRFGPLLENHPIFPERANISVAQIISSTELRLRTWERGVGLTKACGTAACAAAVCAMRKKFVGRDVTVQLPGGPLQISWTKDDQILMTGPAELEYEGEIEVEPASC